MMKIYMLLLAIAFIGCKETEKKGVHQDIWSFDASRNNPQLDNLCSPIIRDYEELLLGLAKKDTAVLFAQSKALMLKLDTLPSFFVTKDTALFQVFKIGLMNIQNELQAVILEQYPEELNMAMHMLSVQLMHFLGEIGYNKQSVYIFNSNGDKALEAEDGLLWLSLNKNTVNPYYNTDNELVEANYILQEYD
jgi:hypothetical protein